MSILLAIYDDDYVCVRVCVLVGYTMDTMYFGQLDSPVDVDENVQMPQFKLIQEFVEDCSQNYTTGMRSAAPPSPSGVERCF